MLAKILWLGIAYVLGSIPFGLVIAKASCGIDPRLDGSKNVGATNVARLCGFPYGVATLLCDLLKGAIPVAIAFYISHGWLFLSLVALAALLGHVRSCFLGFEGGKAVATTVGVFLPLAFFPMLLSCIASALVIWRSGFVSMGSLTLVVVLPVFMFLSGHWAFIPLALVVLALVFWTHRENIARLARGEEKSWLKKKHEEKA
ncbi:MAG: glycerol-3-phosphate 1-O-acyltransferase PlsY [Desulfovibrionales bacterium]|nr:glycerol-3-phosphate 1-O-acyltransferase PlsY [Desulfovibrionales bacterium]